MKIVAVIPARLNSSRLSNKLLRDICGKSLILRTYESAVRSNLFNDVFVITNSPLIEEELKKNNVSYIFKDKEYITGTDRIADISKEIDSEIIINIQGDEPFINSETLQLIIDEFVKDEFNELNVVSVMTNLEGDSDINNPNNVKVVVDKYSNSLYFSRSPIPYNTDGVKVDYFKHVGIYAFRKSCLVKFSKLKPGKHEFSEKIEALRLIENGIDIKMIKSNERFIGIDTLEDLEMARKKFINEKKSI